MTHVPCGKCPQCLARRVSGWSFRLMQEYKRSTTAHFVTLTYDTKFVPISRAGFMTLDKSDVQKFMKRLRKSTTETIKYYLAGEYGGKTARPHYHIILFNVPKMSLIEKAWNLGAVHYGQVNQASVGYTLKYINKAKKIPSHRNDDRLQEFSLMSKGLGDNYITERTQRYHINDLYNRMYLPIEGGKKIAMPRYYKNKIYSEGQLLAVGQYQKQEVLKRLEQLIAEQGETYYGDKAESDMEAFRKHQITARKRDKL